MKGFINLATLAIIGVIAFVGALIAVPGLAGSITSAVTGPMLCEDAPFDPNCECFTGTEKILLNNGIYYICEPIEKLIDIDELGWEQEAITYAEQKLAEQFPECDMNTCDNPNTSWYVGPGSQWTDKKRIILVECNGLGYYFAQALFDVVDGQIEKLGCANYDDIVESVETVESASMTTSLRRENIESRFTHWTSTFSFGCGDIDNGIAFETVESDIPIEEWRIIYNPAGGWNYGNIGGRTRVYFISNQDIGGDTFNLFNGYCEIIETTTEYMSFKCDAGCPYSARSADIQIAGYHQ